MNAHDGEGISRTALPYNEEAEQSVIGSMLISQDAITAASEILTKEDFYRKEYGLLFETMVELDAAHRTVDAITLQNRLREKQVPEEIAGMEYVRDLLNIVPTSVNIRQYAEIVADKANLRRLLALTDEIGNSCRQNGRPAADIMAGAEKSLFELLNTSRRFSDFTPVSQVVMDAIETIEKASRIDGSITGVASGFYQLDKMTAGFQNSDFVLIAARPSMGKTAFALNIAEHMAVRDGKNVAVFSLEMSKRQLMLRLFAQETLIPLQKIRTGNLEDDEWVSIIDAAETITTSGLYIDDTSAISVQELRSKCRKLKLEHGLDLVMIDYLQLMTAGRSFESRQQEVSEISRALKALAKELDVPVIALSQLSRAVEGRSDKRPMMSDLRESGAIEQDADVVMFLYRDDYYNKDTREPGIAELIVGKQRNGPVDTVRLAWKPEYTRFYSIDYSG